MRPNVIRGLIVFCAAARYLSFKMAADDLCITPSAVSHQIKAIEDLLGNALFERRTRAIVLTPIGAALYSRTGPLLNSLDAITSEFLATADRRRVLRISLPQFFASELLIPRLEEFTSRHPSLDIQVDTTEGRELDFPAEADAAVMLLAHAPKGYCVYPLARLSLAPVCSPAYLDDHVLDEPHALGACTLIVHKSRPDAWNDWLAASATVLDSQPRVIELDSMFAVARAAERGLGVALVPIPLSDAWLRSGALVNPFANVLETGERYFFVHRQKSNADKDIVAFANWAADVSGADE